VFMMRVNDVWQRTHITHELLALYTHRVLSRAGILVAGIFTVIFIYKHFGNNLFPVLWTFGLLHLGVAFITPLSARLLRTLGTRTLIIVALPCVIVGFIALYAIAETGSVVGISAVWGIMIYVVSNILYRSLYWVPYLVDLSQLLDRSRRGLQLAILQNAADVNIAAMPFWGGLIVAFLGFGWLFILAVVLVMLSVVPLIWVSNHHEQYAWGYFQTFRELFASRNRPVLYAYAGVGVQAAAQYTVWPLLVFLLLDGEFVAFGAVTALTFFVILMLRFTAGRMFDKGEKSRLLRWGAALSSSGWVLRLFVGTPLSIIAIDTYHGFGQTVNKISVDAMTFEQASDNGRFVDEFTTLKEISANAGRAIALLIVGVFAFFWGEYVGFGAGLILAAIASFGTVKLLHRVHLGHGF
jgi:MFS family permease